MKRTLLSVFLVFTLLFVIDPVTWADDTGDGVSGDTYRVTITPYAKIGSGSDTKSLTSTSVRCK